MDPIDKTLVQFTAARGMPLDTVRLPATITQEIPQLLDAAKRLRPSTTIDDIVRAIFRFGIRNLRNTLQGGEPIDLAKLPGPQKAVTGGGEQ